MTKQELDGYTLAVLKDGIPVPNQREMMKKFLVAAMAEPVGELNARIAELEAQLAAAPAQAEPDAIRNTALEEAAQECWKLQARPEFEPEIQDKWLKIAENKIRSLKS